MENNEIIKKENNEIVKFDKVAYLQKYDPLKVLTSLRHIKTSIQAIENDEVSLALSSKHIWMDSVLALIEVHLASLSESVNVGQPLSKYQIKEIAIEIHSMFYFLSMTEICFVLRKAKRGEYGQLYGVLNIVAILDWFNQYVEERTQVFINKSTQDRHNDHSLRSSDRKELKQSKHYNNEK